MNDNLPGRPSANCPDSPIRSIPSLLRAAGIRMIMATLAILPLAAVSDIRAATFSSAQPMSAARHFHTATLLANGDVLVAGAQLHNIAETYNPGTGTWTRTGDMLSIRQYHTATLLQNGMVLVAGGSGATAADQPTQTYRTCELYDPATGTWTATGSMNAARTRHTATLLNDGRVLVTGGSPHGGSALSSAEIFNPATGRWSSVAQSMSLSRENHTASLLADGRVLLVGTWFGTSPAAAEIFNPATNTFTQTGTTNAGRRQHSATRLPDGRVLVAGGGSGSSTLASAEIYDPATGLWTTTGSMSAARSFHGAVLLPNGRVMVCGGFQSNTLSSATIFNPETGTWAAAGSLGASRSYHGATMMDNGRVLITGGWGRPALATVEIFDWVDGAWAGTTDSLANDRQQHTMTLLPNGRILVAGGLNSDGNPTAAERYDPAANAWETAGTMLAGRHDHTATLLHDGRVLVAGGFSDSSGDKLSSAEVYDPAQNSWTPTASLACKRSRHTATLLPNGWVLVAGGGENGSLEEIYDPVSGTWSIAGALSTPREDASATLLPDGKVLVAGGRSGGQNLRNAELFDPSTRTWTPTGLMNTARARHGAVLLPNGRVFVCGGQGGGSSTEAYDPVTGTWGNRQSMAAVRHSHSTTLLPDGRVLVAGGYGSFGIISGTEIYNHLTNRWTAAPAMARARGDHTAVRLPSGLILIAAGAAGTSSTAECERFNPGSSQLPAWKPVVTTSFPSPVEIGSTLSINGTGFRGISESSSGGNNQNSPANHPIVILSSVANGQRQALAATSWNTTSVVTGPIAGLHPGWTYATVVVNGIPSEAKLLRIQGSSNADLSELVLSDTTLTPSFQSALTAYSTTVPYTVSEVSVTAGVRESGAMLRVRINSEEFVPTAPETASQPLALAAGTNTLEVVVTAPDGSTTKSYVVTIIRNHPRIEVKIGDTYLVNGAADPVDFGPVAPGDGKSLALVISNPGSDDLVLGEIVKEGVNAGDFIVGLPTGTTVQPGESVEVPLSFSPSAAGVKTAEIRLMSNVTGSDNPFVINLKGTANTAPAFAGFSASTHFQTPASIMFAKILARASDADGDPVTITAVASGSNGGSATLQGQALVYTPPTGFSGTETIPITLGDGRGAFTEAAITMNVAARIAGGEGSLATNPPRIQSLPEGKIAVSFHGIPGRVYQIQRSATLDDWQPLATVTAGPDGRIEFTDDNPPSPSGYYRLAITE